MNLDEIIRLISAVSDSSLSKFDLEEGNLKLSMMTDKMPAPVLQAVVSHEAALGLLPGNAMQISGQEGAKAAGILKEGAAAGTYSLGGEETLSAQAASGAGMSGKANPTGQAAIEGRDAGSKVELSGAAGAEIPSDKVVKSPLVGTFYNASSPETDPFVAVGDAVKKGQVLGIIEAMKLMNEIESEYDGVVEAVLVENEQVVEYGQPLFRIR